MRLIHSTQKLLKEMNVSSVETPGDIFKLDGLGNWYANLFKISRTKCLLFTNEKSLYSFLIPNVVKATLKNFKEEFRTNLSFNLQYEGFSAEVVDRVMHEYKEIGFAKTASLAP